MSNSADAARALSAKSLHADPSPESKRRGARGGLVLTILALGLLALAGIHVFREKPALAPGTMAAPNVTVSVPLKRDLAARLQFLGQFSAIERVDLRAQVGGTLVNIGFKDGETVHKGDVLFEVDPTPYEIRISQATAQLESANARLDLATRELARANELRRTSVNTQQEIDQRASERQATQAAVDSSRAMVRDAKFDLDHCRVTAPFTGHIGNHFVSIGNLIAGSRAGSSPTTLLATIVSLDPIYFDFDMSEAEYLAFMRQQAGSKTALAAKVYLSLSDEARFSHEGTLDFVDNSLNRASGTIHARATIPNPDLLLTPGGFARAQLALSGAQPALLVPDAAVLPDQSSHIVLTVGADDTITPKHVTVGALRGGLRVVSGLDPSDRVVIEGITSVRPGAKVTTTASQIRFDEQQD